MKFEEVLPQLRAGKKARLPSFSEKGDYFIAGYTTIYPGYDDKGNLTECDKILTIYLLNKDEDYIVDKYSWGIPGWAIMREDWEIVE